MWIAFKNYYLRDEEQHISKYLRSSIGCELLSKIIIFVTRNNKKVNHPEDYDVVNCFQKLLSSWRGTTKASGSVTTTSCELLSKIIIFVTRNNIDLSILLKYKLWIAFKNYYLRDEEQLWGNQEFRTLCCELLSKIIIFVTRNNIETKSQQTNEVVNCFQKLLSSWRGTTGQTLSRNRFPLWIAFKNYYLRDEEQLLQQMFIKLRSCELLSKIIIFVTRNNVELRDRSVWIVVNCFQKLLSSWRGTTIFRECDYVLEVVNCFQKLLSSWRGTTSDFSDVMEKVLWIAFKNYYLRDEEQHQRQRRQSRICCELLSKIIIFVTRNNKDLCKSLSWRVVNCFQKLLSSWRGTTENYWAKKNK